MLLPKSVIESILPVKNELVRLQMSCKFVEDYNIHLCLSFLGEIEECRVETVCNGIDEIGKESKSFDVEVTDVKMIPNEKYIRVLALDVVENENMKKLRMEVKTKIGGDSKPCHITLCRVKDMQNKVVAVQKIKEIKFYKKFTFDRLQLIKSELKRSGPVYSVVHEALLE
jgi:2'-5' RNA ligase